MPTVAEYLKYANLQLAAEAFLKNPETGAEYYSGSELIRVLKAGNHHASYFTETQAVDFAAQWQVVDQLKNTPTGFSGTLFRNRANPNELVISFRSTEAYDDAIRDGAATNTQEIHSTGWAWGQIADMEAWYSQLKATGLIPEGAQLNATGYSLGGHLVTAFHQLHPGELNQVFTYNGAGVGEVKTGTLAEALDYFNTLRGDNAESAAQRLEALNLTQLASRNYYADLIQNLADKTWNEQQALAALQAVKTSIGTVNPELLAQELEPLRKALADIVNLQQEAARIQGFTSGATPNQADLPIQAVPLDQIEAQSLAYRLAITLASQRTQGTNLFADLGHITEKEYGPGDPLPNQYELVGKETTHGPAQSGVANSQYHYGIDDGVYIEDQPLTRGSFTINLVNGFLAGGLHLLQNHYKLNSFADTHSLTLIIDSLNTQNTLLNLLPDSQRNTPETRNALQQIMFNASRYKADAQLGGQGQAEGDVMENILNALGALMLGPDQWKTLRGDSTGGSWYYDKDHTHADGDGEWVTYNGRTRFYQALEQLTHSDAYTALQSRLTLTPLKPDLAAGIRDTARTDFAAFAALYTLSPFRLGGPGLEATVGGAWGKTYQDWQADQGLDAAARAAGQAKYSDDWYTDRGDFLKYWLQAAAGNQLVVQDSSLDNTTDQRIYKQLDSGQKVVVQNSVGGGAEPLGDKGDSQYYLFGGKQLDLLDGNRQADHLYGMGGLDVLTGGQGKDRLEGGTSLDFYRFRTGDGEDVLLDTDRRALLQRNDELFTLAYKTGDGAWVGGTDANAFTATRSGDDLILTFADNPDDSITLKNFDFAEAGTGAGSYGLRLIGDLPARPEDGRLFTGDLQDWDSDSGRSGIQPVQDDLGNTIRADGEGGRPLIGSPNRDDWFNGSDGNDLFPFQDEGGNDTVYGNGGNDRMELGAGRDTAYAGSNDDWVEGGAEGDILYGDAGKDVIFADTSDDGELTLEDAIKNGEAGEGTGEADLLSGNGGDDTLIGGAGGDALMGGFGRDILVGGAGNDNLYGDAELLSATLDWNLERRVEPGETVTMYWSILHNGNWEFNKDVGEADLLIGGAGDDWAIGGGGDDLVLGGIGNDVLFGDTGSDILQGGEGDDVLSGDEAFLADSLCGDDILDGGAGNDMLWGYAGNDVLIGGTGDDTLTGSSGKDVYIYNKGDGKDTIYDTPVGADDPEASVLVLGPGITKADVKFRLGSLHVDVGNGEGVHFEGFDSDDPYATPVVGEIRFDDGSVMNYQDILAQGFDIDGTADDDSLVGSAVTDRMDGGEGNDSLWGKGGHDTLLGGDGNDRLMGDDNASELAGELHGDDSLDGGVGNDTLFGAGGHDTLLGGEGDDRLVGDDNASELAGEFHGDDSLDGGAGNDTLFGAGGHDTLLGGEGDDRLVGDDNASELAGEFHGDDSLDGGAGNDTLFGAGGHDTLLGGDGDDWLVGDDGSSELAAEFHGDDSLDGGVGNDTLLGYGGGDTLAGGVGRDWLDGGEGDDRLDGMDDDDTLIGGHGNDILAGGAGSDQLDGGWGDDQLDGMDGDDTLIGGYDNDILAGGAGNDQLDGGEGDDRLDGMDGDDTLFGDEGHDILAGGAGSDQLDGGWGDDQLDGMDGDDTLIGGYDNDILAGGAGSDQLDGGWGDDVYRFNPGDGADVIIDNAGTDTLVFGEGFAAADLVVRAVSYVDGRQSLEIDFGSDDRLSITDGHLGAVERFRFADGTEMSLADIMQRVPGYVGGGTAWSDVMEGSGGDDALRGFGGYDTLRGHAGDDLLEGGDGGDLLEGGAGDDELFGGTGNDTLIGGEGRDTYYLHLGMGADRVIEAGGQSSLIRVDSALGAGDYAVTRVGDDLRMALNGTSDSLTLAGYFAESGDWAIDAGEGEMPLADFLAAASVPASGVTPYQQAMTQFRREMELTRQSNLSGQGYARDAGGVWRRTYSGENSMAYDINSGLVFTTLQSDDAVITVDGMQQYLTGSETSVERRTVSRISFGLGGGQMPQQRAAPYFILLGSYTSHSGSYTSHGGWMGADPNVTGVFSVGVPSGPGVPVLIGYWVYPTNWSEPTPLSATLFEETGVTAITYRWEYRSTLVEAGGADNEINVNSMGGVAADGGAGNDVINGYDSYYRALPVLLYGNEGDDILNGGSGDDLLVGGAGRDVLDGRDGADRYFLENEAAGDLIVDRGGLIQRQVPAFAAFGGGSAETDNDVVIFPEGVAVGDLRFSWGDEPILLPNEWYSNLGVFDTVFQSSQEMAAVLTLSWGIDNCVRVYVPNAEREVGGIEAFRFSDGTSLTRAQLLALAPEYDLDPREQANAFDGSGVLSGFGGNDTISGGAESDSIDGGDGNDVLMGGDGNDWITGGRGADTLEGGGGDDTLGVGCLEFWGEGSEYRGGAGNDLLLGTVDSDTYYFNLGEGQDIIRDFFHENGYDSYYSDYYEFNQGGSQFFEMAGAPDNLASLQYQYDWQAWRDAAETWSYRGQDTIRLGSGINPEDIEVSLEDNGDLILRHINGQDSIRIEAGNLGKESPIGRIEFADGTVWRKSALGDFSTETVLGTAASETLRGTEGVDEFWSGTGDDVMIGQEGYDIYHFAAGDGQDVIVENLRAAVSPNGSDGARGGEVQFDGFDPDRLDVARSGDDLVLSIAGERDTLTIQSWFAEPGRIDRFVFAGGTTWDAAMIEQRLAANHAPTIANPVADQEVNEDTVFNFTVPANTFADIDAGDSLSYDATLANGDPLPAWLTFDAATRTFSGTPTNGDVGNLQLRVTATDPAGASASQGFALAVTGPTGTGEILNGTPGADTLLGGTGNDTLDGGGGADRLIGGIGNDTYIIDNTGDVVTEAANEGTDLVQSSVTHTLSANVENLTLTGTSAINGTGNALDNTLTGNAANNLLNGGAGNDTLDGGTGNDTLTGGLGNDTYRFGHGDGQDTITYDSENSAGKWNILQFKADVVPGDVTVRRSGENLILTLAGGEDRVTINSFFTGGTPGSGVTNPIQEVRFTDGTIWNLATLVTKALAGTDGADGISGTTGDDLLDGGPGNDTFYGGPGNDTLLGGEGNDGICGEAGGDTLLGGPGSDTCYGGPGDDVLDGGQGNDALSGGLGNDTYRFGKGDGWDSIYTDPDNSAGKWNVLEFKENIHPDEVSAVRSGSNLWLKLAGSTEGVSLQGFFSGNAPGTGIDNPIQEVKFADGTIWNLETLVAKAMTGGDGADSISGTTGTNILQGGAGNDTLTDTSGAALFHGGAGADALTGGAEAEIFLGGLGNDTVTTVGGNDIILFNKGDGQDTFASGGTGDDTLSLGGSGLNYADLAFAKSSNDLILKIGTTDQITFKNWYASTPSKPVTHLQVMAEAMDGFAQGGSDPLKDQKVESFDFAGLAGAFDAARAANSGLTSWALSNALSGFMLAGSDTAAMGGDLAYQYGKSGTLAGIGVTPALGTLSDTNLGTNPQALSSLASLQTGTVRLS